MELFTIKTKNLDTGKETSYDVTIAGINAPQDIRNNILTNNSFNNGTNLEVTVIKRTWLSKA